MPLTGLIEIREGMTLSTKKTRLLINGPESLLMEEFDALNTSATCVGEGSVVRSV